MASHYAHYYFGREVIRNMPEDIKETINTSKESVDAFLIGLQGPDFLAFYLPYTHNSLNKEGSEIHKSPGTQFFSRAIAAAKKADTPEALSYLLGSLCHYMLDSKLHTVILSEMQILEVSHAKIEREFDNYLLKTDGKSPYNLNCKVIFPYNKKLGAVISDFYRTTTPKKVNQAIAQMDRYLSLMCSRSTMLRTGIYGILSAIRIEGVKNKRDMVLSDIDDHICDETNKILFRLLKECVGETMDEINNLLDSMRNGAPLSDRLNLNYMGK